MDNQFPRWVALKDIQPFDVIVIRDQCITVYHISDPDVRRLTVSGAMLTKYNTKLFGILVLVPMDELVLILGRSTKDRSWTPMSLSAQRPPED